jgi:hypothetical protein
MSSPPITTGSASISHRTFSALVQNDADLVGHVAYALYKRDKLKFSEEFRARNSREPLPAEVEIFIVGCNLDTRLQGYRAEAELLLEAMTEYQLDDAIEQVRIDANEELARKLSESKSWGRSIAEALIGSVAVAVMWAALVLILYTNKVGFDRMAKDIMNIDVSGANTPPPPSAASAASR